MQPRANSLKSEDVKPRVYGIYGAMIVWLLKAREACPLILRVGFYGFLPVIFRHRISAFAMSCGVGGIRMSIFFSLYEV